MFVLQFLKINLNELIIIKMKCFYRITYTFSLSQCIQYSVKIITTIIFIITITIILYNSTFLKLLNYLRIKYFIKIIHRE